eukprot:4512631-Heterocapsa_arctica.AAC.1
MPQPLPPPGGPTPRGMPSRPGMTTQTSATIRRGTLAPTGARTTGTPASGRSSRISDRQIRERTKPIRIMRLRTRGLRTKAKH